MKLAVTASQKGITKSQCILARQLFVKWKVTELHHGDCVGGDAQLNDIALELGIRIVLHPPSDPSRRAFCKGADEVREPKPYLDRNHDMVEECTIVLGFPRSKAMQIRSGTWATVRYGASRKSTYTVEPLGAVRIWWREGGRYLSELRSAA